MRHESGQPAQAEGTGTPTGARARARRHVPCPLSQNASPESGQGLRRPGGEGPLLEPPLAIGGGPGAARAGAAAPLRGQGGGRGRRRPGHRLHRRRHGGSAIAPWLSVACGVCVVCCVCVCASMWCAYSTLLQMYHIEVSPLKSDDLRLHALCSSLGCVVMYFKLHILHSVSSMSCVWSVLHVGGGPPEQ